MTHIRLAGADDLDAIAVLFDAYRQLYEQTPDLPMARRFIGERLQQGESILLIAEAAEGRIVGFCQIYPTFCSVLMAPVGVLYDLLVTPEARGMGVGRALLLAAEAHAADAGMARMDLSTGIHNRTAQTLYESLGCARDEAFCL